MTIEHGANKDLISQVNVGIITQQLWTVRSIKPGRLGWGGGAGADGKHRPGGQLDS